MGYTTDFAGAFTVDPPLDRAQIDYLLAFSRTRRVARDPMLAAEMSDPVRYAVGLDLGEPDAAYFVGAQGYMGQDADPSVLDQNAPPGGRLGGWVIPNGRKIDRGFGMLSALGERCPLPEPHRVYPATIPQGHICELGTWREPQPNAQPGLWCQWVPAEDGCGIMWDGGEKFYEYIEWIKYLLDHFIKPWGRTLTGQVEWQGEERDDMGIIIARGDHIEVAEGKVAYGDPMLV